MSLTITRRRILWLPLLSLPIFNRRVSATEPATSLTFDEFLATAEPLAKELVRDSSATGQDVYLYRLAALAVRLGAVDERPLFSMGAAAPGVSLAPRSRGIPFRVIEWKMAPHGRFPPHDHPNYSVCTVCVDGECEVTHYERAGDGVRRSRAQTLVAGRVTTLSATRDNIHTFATGERGARGLDITTPHGADAGFHWIDFDERGSGVLPAKLRLVKS
jgi:hypothetical protein